MIRQILTYPGLTRAMAELRRLAEKRAAAVEAARRVSEEKVRQLREGLRRARERQRGG